MLRKEQTSGQSNDHHYKFVMVVDACQSLSDRFGLGWEDCVDTDTVYSQLNKIKVNTKIQN